MAADFDCGEDAVSSNWTSPDEALPLLKEANNCGMMGFFKQVNHTFYFTNSEQLRTRAFLGPRPGLLQDTPPGSFF